MSVVETDTRTIAERFRVLVELTKDSHDIHFGYHFMRLIELYQYIVGRFPGAKMKEMREIIVNNPGWYVHPERHWYTHASDALTEYLERCLRDKT